MAAAVSKKAEQLLQEGMPPEKIAEELEVVRKNTARALKEAKAIVAKAKKDGIEEHANASESPTVKQVDTEEEEIEEHARESPTAGPAEDKDATPAPVAVGMPVSLAPEPAGGAGTSASDKQKLPKEAGTSASGEPQLPKPNPNEQKVAKKQRTDVEPGPNRDYLSAVQADLNTVLQCKAYKGVAQAEPLPICKDAECGIQEPFDSRNCATALHKRGVYNSGCNFFWLDLLRSPTPGIPLSRKRVEEARGLDVQGRPYPYQGTDLRSCQQCRLSSARAQGKLADDRSRGEGPRDPNEGVAGTRRPCASTRSCRDRRPMTSMAWTWFYQGRAMVKSLH